MVNSPESGPHDEQVVETDEDRQRLSYRRARASVSAAMPASPSSRALDVDEDDDDEGDEDQGSYSISTKSQIAIQTVYENERRYCNDTYFMPNDEAEQTRLNISHQAFLVLLEGELTKAPLPPHGPNRVLDIGTGPGDWAVEMGQQYPDATIIATDIGVFDGCPAILGLPNVHFQLDDAEEEWTYHEPFDLVHFRSLSGAFRDWQAVYEQAFKHIKPGGYIEVVDSDLATDSLTFKTPNPNSYYNIFISAMRNAAELLGFPRSRDHVDPSLLTSVGFVDVVVHDLTVPVGTWPKDPRQSTLGKMVLIVFLEGLEAISLRHLTATGKWTMEEVRDMCQKVQQEALTSEGSTISVRFMTGRKPDA